MADIRIPFLEEFHAPLVASKKTATSRSRRYGRVGDRFALEVEFPEAPGCPAWTLEINRLTVPAEVDGGPEHEHAAEFCGRTDPHEHTWELISDPTKVHLGIVLDHLWDIEGLDSPAHAWRIWRKIHPRKQWTGSEQVFLHRFVRVG